MTITFHSNWRSYRDVYQKINGKSFVVDSIYFKINKIVCVCSLERIPDIVGNGKRKCQKRTFKVKERKSRKTAKEANNEMQGRKIELERKNSVNLIKKQLDTCIDSK